MALCCFYSGVGQLNSIRSSMYLLQDAEANQFCHASCVPHVRFRLGQQRNLPTIRPHPFHPAMPHNGFDRASIATQQSASTIASTFSTIWSKVPSSRGKIALSLDDLCSYLRATTDVEHSPIEELIIRKEEGGVQHEFLLILLYKPSGEEFWICLERARPLGTLRRFASSVLEANDIVSALIDN